MSKNRSDPSHSIAARCFWSMSISLQCSGVSENAIDHSGTVVGVVKANPPCTLLLVIVEIAVPPVSVEEASRRSVWKTQASCTEMTGCIAPAAMNVVARHSGRGAVLWTLGKTPSATTDAVLLDGRSIMGPAVGGLGCRAESRDEVST